MITQETVLILGAGASIPFYFPSGPGLKQICLDMIKRKGHRFELLRQLGHEEDRITEFRDTLARSGQKSVDAFLQHGPEFVEIGKAAIAIALLPIEKTSNLFEEPIITGTPNWYEYLFSECLNCPFEEFDQNKLSVITFNYDRSLEHYLFTALKNTHHKQKDEEVAEKLAAIKFIHVYGKLGYLSWQKPRLSFVPYGFLPNNRKQVLYTRRASEHIRIIHEEVDVNQDAIFKEAHELLRNAQRIYFLGFGFNEINFKRLMPQEVIKKKNISKGTAKDLSPHQRRKIGNLGFGAINSGTHIAPEEFIYTLFRNETIYEFLYYNQRATLD